MDPLARPESDPKTPMAARLRELRRAVGEPDRDAMAAKIGVAKSTLASYERGETEPSASALASYREAYGANVVWIISGVGEMFGDPSNVPVAPLQVDAKLVREMHSTIERMAEATLGTPARSPRRFEELPPPSTLKYYPVFASAGSGLAALYESPGRDLDIDDFCDLAFHTSSKHITLHPIRGESMTPTLADGSIAVIDRRVTGEPEDNTVYLVSLDGDVYVKRAQWQADNTLAWFSDNTSPQYAPIRLTAAERATMTILGKLIGVIHTV